MAKGDPEREARLAAKLRENLRRRKAQSRELPQAPGESGSEPADPALPKEPPAG